MLKRFKQWLRFKKPRTLPIGMTSFNSWVDDIVVASGLPDNPSTRQLAAQFLMHTPPTVRKLSISTIADQMCRAASYQVAKEVLAPTGPNLQAVPSNEQPPKASS